MLKLLKMNQNLSMIPTIPNIDGRSNIDCICLFVA